MSASNLPYSEADLLVQGAPPPRRGRQLDTVAFPLGGIGTGMVSLGGWGQLRDWEIHNRPAKGAANRFAFFMLRCRHAERTVTKVLQGPVGGYYLGDGHTLGHNAGEGLPHFREVSFDGRFPIATVNLTDPEMPLDVELEAFSPFIPLNARDSSLPAAILVYRLTNPRRRTVEATLFGNLSNDCGDPKRHTRSNKARRAKGVEGLWLTTEEEAGEDPTLGTMALSTPLGDVGILPSWSGFQGHQLINHYWQLTAESDIFPPPAGKSGGVAGDTGTIAIDVSVAPGQTIEVPIFITWHFPVCRHWQAREEDGQDVTPTWQNWYATEWSDAWDVAAYVAKHYPRLRAETTLFRDSLFESTLPSPVLDAVSSQLSILKTPTCLRLTDGTFYGFEGCSNTCGCCEGSCTHVWNYAQALPFLFPDLQRSVREADWNNSLLDDGWVTFRMPLPLGTKATPNFFPAADGQMGTVIQVWREYLISGDLDWLKSIWPHCKQALEFAWVYWDADRDGLMEGLQHNTYDNEWYGPNTMCGSLYLAALRAGEELAKLVGDTDAAATYREVFESGSVLTDQTLYNGEYYEQQVEPGAAQAWPEAQRNLTTGRGTDSRMKLWPAWQFGKGCLSDQLLGQWYADQYELGDLYLPDHIDSTLQAIFRHNWKPSLSGHCCTLRVYAVDGEAGLLIATWPRGERPGDPFWFADEVWCGIEYQVASHLILRGQVTSGLAIVKGVRDRYTGERRNPWDEIECGHHYARSMASYSLLTSLSGFHYHAAEHRLAFDPKVSVSDFRAFFSVGSGWGMLGQRRDDNHLEATVQARYGRLDLNELQLGSLGSEPALTVVARLGQQPVKAEAEARDSAVMVRFPDGVELVPGRTLRVTVRRA